MPKHGLASLSTFARVRRKRPARGAEDGKAWRDTQNLTKGHQPTHGNEN
jgi:hypothetical protein